MFHPFLFGGTMNWYVVDKEYVKHLSQSDSRVGYVEYGDKLKLHVGILLQVNETNYYVPVSSPKPKHYKMSNSIDFHKIIDPKSGQLYAVININNMIPVPTKCVTQLKYNKISEFRSFVDDTDMTNYIYLLQKEKSIIDSIDKVLQEKAEKLHKKCIDNPDSKLASRCCRFNVLEELCNNY